MEPKASSGLLSQMEKLRMIRTTVFLLAILAATPAAAQQMQTDIMTLQRR